MLDFVARTSNPSHKKTAISSRYRSDISSRYSRRALSIEGVVDRGRPPPLNGALVVPKQRRFERIALTERGLQSATSAIRSVFRGLLTDLRGCEVRSHFRRLVADILLGRLAQFVKIPRWSWWGGWRVQSWHFDSRDKTLTLEDL